MSVDDEAFEWASSSSGKLDFALCDACGCCCSAAAPSRERIPSGVLFVPLPDSELANLRFLLGGSRGWVPKAEKPIVAATEEAGEGLREGDIFGGR